LISAIGACATHHRAAHFPYNDRQQWLVIDANGHVSYRRKGYKSRLWRIRAKGVGVTRSPVSRLGAAPA